MRPILQSRTPTPGRRGDDISSGRLHCLLRAPCALALVPMAAHGSPGQPRAARASFVDSGGITPGRVTADTHCVCPGRAPPESASWLQLSLVSAVGRNGCGAEMPLPASRRPGPFRLPRLPLFPRSGYPSVPVAPVRRRRESVAPG